MFYHLAKLFHRKSGYLLGASAFVPLPDWVRNSMRALGYSTREMVHVYARLAVGSDLSQITDNEVGCAESVSRILRGVNVKLLPRVIPGTATLDEELADNPYYKEVSLGEVLPGDIIISPTRKHAVGHTGILGAVVRGERLIYSNTSSNGLFLQNYTLRGWLANYRDKLRLEVKFYRIKI